MNSRKATIKCLMSRFICFYLLINCCAVIASEKKKRRCKKVCKPEFEELKQRVQELEAKLNLLLSSNSKTPEIHYVQGPKGDKGEPGPKGPPGPRGDRGYMGLPGRAGKDGYVISVLPRCRIGEYISSDGNNLFCLKLGTVYRPVLRTTPKTIASTTSNIIKPVFPNEGSTPTMEAGMKKKLASFTKRHMAQALKGDAWDLHSFVWRHNAYLGIIKLGANAFTLYKWLDSLGYYEKAVITIEHARKWTSFEWQDSLFIIITCNTIGAANRPSHSYIYKMTSYDSVELFQEVNTTQAYGVDTVKKDGQIFIIILNAFGQQSDVLKWKNNKFILHQSIGVTGFDIDAFHIGDRTFISSVGKSSRGRNVNLLEYNDDTFVPFKNIPLEIWGYGITHIKIDSEHFLAVAQYELPRSVIFKWNGETFEKLQQIDTCKARDFSAITTNQMGKKTTYLAVVNYDCKPVIYVYDNNLKKFLKLQQTDSKKTRDMEFLRLPNRDKIYLAVSTRKQTAIYAGSAS